MILVDKKKHLDIEGKKTFTQTGELQVFDFWQARHPSRGNCEDCDIF